MTPHLKRGAKLTPEQFWPFPWDKETGVEDMKFARMESDPVILARLKARHAKLGLN